MSLSLSVFFRLLRHMAVLLPVCFLLAGKIPGAVAQSDRAVLSLTFRVLPVTVVSAVSETGAASVNIGPLVPGVDDESRLLRVHIRTNTSLPYRVYHEIQKELTSNTGARFPEGELFFRVSGGERGGISRVPGWEPVSDLRKTIFESASYGGMDSFTVHYQIRSRKPFQAGDYFGYVYIGLDQG